MGLFSNKGGKVARTADDNPQALADHLDKLEDLLKSRNENAIINATYAVAVLSEVDSDSAVTLVHTCAKHLGASHESIRMNVTSVMAEVVKEYPDQVLDYDEELAKRAKSDANPQVRGNAVRALAGIGTEVARETLEKVKKSDQDPDIRKVAMEMAKESTETPISDDFRSNKTGMLESCTECSTDFGKLGGIPRRCPGCGSGIKNML